MRTLLVACALLLTACPSKSTPPPPATGDAAVSLNPYHNAMPQKVKADVEKIQDDEDKRNEEKRKQAIEGQ